MSVFIEDPAFAAAGVVLKGGRLIRPTERCPYGYLPHQDCACASLDPAKMPQTISSCLADAFAGVPTPQEMIPDPEDPE